MKAKKKNSDNSYIFKSQHFTSYSPPSINKIGQKAASLITLSKEQTPPFIIISTEVFNLWKGHLLKDDITIIRNAVTCALDELKQFEYTDVIARSSATVESLDERGTFDSIVSSNNIEVIIDNVLSIYSKANLIIENSDRPENELAIIIQGYIVPVYEGHLSNERRTSDVNTNWVVEYNSKDQNGIKLYQFDTLKAESKDLPNPSRLFESLKKLAKLKEESDKRYHFEWVWDGKQLHIVQQDVEIEFKGSAPGSEWKVKEGKIPQQELLVFVKEKNALNDWSKAQHVKTFRECDLPYGDVYVLENSEIINEIANSTISEKLERDLRWLLKYPIVIRTSLKVGDSRPNLMLPRTHTLFSFEEAVEYLKKYTADFKNEALTENDFAFLIHRFIISKACAFSFTKPNDSRVRIDSSWGFADGLGYNAYDSFETYKDKTKINKKVRCKSEYLDVDQNGKWQLKKSGADWDWKQSLTKDEILKIRNVSLKIANYLNKEVIIMFFINDGKSKIYPNVLPWHYSVKEIPDFASGKGVAEHYFLKEKVVISKKVELEVLLKVLEQTPNKKVIIKLKLDVNSVRNVPFLDEIALVAETYNCPIELDGSLLAHAYYILSSKGAHIRTVDNFDPKPQEKLHFNKLVRDKIPEKIESHGEVAKTYKLPSSKLIELLKIKAIEEVYELLATTEATGSVEELADILEVIRALCKPLGITFKELESIADKKKTERGGFDEGIFLEETNKKSLFGIRKDESLRKEPIKLNYRNSITVEGNEITIPYIPSSEKQKPIPIEIINADMVVKYSPRGIKITIRKKRDIGSDPNQLNFFNTL